MDYVTHLLVSRQRGEIFSHYRNLFTFIKRKKGVISAAPPGKIKSRISGPFFWELEARSRRLSGGRHVFWGLVTEINSLGRGC